MIPKKFKDWIDSASYEELLSKWRFEPVESPWFQGEIGIYLETALKAKREEVGQEAHVRASKSIGWVK